MKKISVLIVDDEPLAREGVEALLAPDPEVQVVGTAGDGQSALTAIRHLRPDLVFLDVQMPKRSGFEVLAELKASERPRVIFVTAYDEYALRAFEFYAVDYLLKPLQEGRFAAALARAKSELHRSESEDIGRRLNQLLAHLRGLENERVPPPPAAEAPDRLVVKAGSDHHFIRLADILWIESQGDFVKIHATGPARLMRETLQSLQRRLDEARFLRIHRSFVVNVDHVRQVTPALYGDYSVLMSDGSKLRLSRNYRKALKTLLSSPAPTRGG